MSVLRLAWYHYFVIVDTFRRPAMLVLHVCIVAGVCLPVLVLRGINRGHVSELRQSLETSPLGRQVVIWSAQHGPILDDDSLLDLTSRVSGIELLIPDVTAVVGISDRRKQHSIDGITLRSTRPGDPVLTYRSAAVTSEGSREIVLSQAAAAQLNVTTGDEVLLTLYRAGETHEVAFRVSGILSAAQTTTRRPNETDSNTSRDTNGHNVGFIDIHDMNRIQDYLRGFPVSAWNIPSSRQLTAPDQYISYLIFCKNDDDLRTEDFQLLRQSYDVRPVTDVHLRTLYGLLHPSTLQELSVYELSSPATAFDPSTRLSITPRDISRKTYADEVVLPWNEPRLLTIGDTKYLCVGITLEDPCWLRRYFADRDLAFRYDANEFQIRFVRGSIPKRADAPLQIAPDTVVQLMVAPSPSTVAKVEPAQQSQSGKSQGELRARILRGTIILRKFLRPWIDTAIAPTLKLFEKLKAVIPPGYFDSELLPSPQADPNEMGDPTSQPPHSHAAVSSEDVGLALVPIQLLAHVDAFNRGKVLFDPQLKHFVPIPDKPRYDKARLYARTIDDVPGVVSACRELRFACSSEEERISEIMDHKTKLDVLVFTVGIIVFLFGIATVATVLWDSTSRKRKDIGILRIMGVSGVGILYMVFFRAAIIGLLSTLLAFGVAWTACGFLSYSQPPLDGSWWSRFSAEIIEWKRVYNLTANAYLDLREDWVIGCVALGCSLIGAIPPGVRASMLDPFEAVVQAKDA